MSFVSHARQSVFITRGRANRREYFYYTFLLGVLILIMVVAILSILSASFRNARGSELMMFTIIQGFLGALVYGFYLLRTFGLLVRRIHDLGWSDGVAFFIVVPYLNFIFWLLLCVIPGNPYPNQHGDRAWDPASEASGQQQPSYGPPPQYGAPPQNASQAGQPSANPGGIALNKAN